MALRKDALHGEQTYLEGHTAHTGQIFFPEEFAAELMKHEPYIRHRIHRTTQTEDHVFEEQHGVTMVAQLQPVDARHPQAGHIAELVVGVDPQATPAPVRMGGPGGFGPGMR